ASCQHPARRERPACARPNKRLKLTGGDRSSGSGVLCPGAHELSFNYTARGGRVARSLSAIRSGSARSVTYPGAARVLSSDMTRFHGLLTAALLGALVACDASGLGGPRERTLLVQDHAVE